MRVLINRVLTLGNRTGIGHYAFHLIRHLRRQAPGDIVRFPRGWFWRLGRTLSGPILSRGEKTASNSDTTATAVRILRRKAVLALRRLGQAYLMHSLHKSLRREACDLYHEPNTIPLPCDVPTVATIHDLSVILHPEWHPAGRVAYFEKHLPLLLRSSHFIAVSEFTRQEAIKTLGLPPGRVTRVYNGIRADLKPMAPEAVRPALQHLSLPPRFLLYVGTIEPRKNVLLLLQAYVSLPENLRRQCPLVLAGSWGWSSAAVAEFYHAQARDRGVIHLGYMDDSVLPALYNAALALVYPSGYEGFGLPPVEMLACGGAVLAASAGAVEEIVGGQAHLIHPDDLDGWRAALARIIQDDDWRHGLRAGAVERARSFSWDGCAAETLQVYRTLGAKAEHLPRPHISPNHEARSGNPPPGSYHVHG
jgi:glycosyltransferase involved in cell wall biosynthesis